WLKPTPIMARTPNTCSQYSCATTDKYTTNWVGAGSSAPKLLNISWKVGTTFTNRMTVTIKAMARVMAGYISAVLIFFFSDSVFSLYTATLSSMDSSAPACSPDSTRLQVKSAKYSGCCFSAEAKSLPAETLSRMVYTSSFIETLSMPSATMSNDCTSGTPALIMVAIWRVKKVMSDD